MQITASVAFTIGLIAGVSGTTAFFLSAPAPPVSRSRQDVASVEAKRNRAASRRYLEVNAARDGIERLESGLQFQILRPGTGKRPVDGEILAVRMAEQPMSENPLPFSYRSLKAVELKINQTLPGLRAGLGLMRPGAAFRFFVPPELAFGDSARPGVPAGSAIIYDVELSTIK